MNDYLNGYPNRDVNRDINTGVSGKTGLRNPLKIPDGVCR